MEMKKVVIKISGKFISPLDEPLVKEYAKIIDELYERGYNMAVVVGGGSTARKYIEHAPESKSLKDFIGIEAARLNALLLSLHVKNAIKKVPKSVNEVLELMSSGKVVIAGGMQPGQSTNAVSLVLAELMNADMVVNATTVDAIYTEPPNSPGAKKLSKVSYDEVKRILESSGWKQEPGRYELFDALSLEIAKRSNIPIAVVYGGDPSNVRRAIVEGICGTLVTS
ncbi:uridylate kinase [Ignicoccus pacificus DSM 13166]|uniref:Uridylate kinase n=1 Tax=Ignicoccus pacificus DSM 13166 TaxID=940294 RepID=A0A977KBA7_9CREN|nr:uridylate kinase [Ignicoccus pacificus DSM 13166]